ncbi:hypothetical protein BT69DRAFT_1318244 [Atractiella rhizophila]|nr:hypothetical protein BT69DRAFT_1318244 [Atractiella rhizophila]
MASLFPRFRHFSTSSRALLISRRPLPVVGAPKDPNVKPVIPEGSKYLWRPYIQELAKLDKEEEVVKRMKEEGADGYRWLKVTQKRSSIGLPPKTKAILKVLRLKRRLGSSYHPPTPSVLGQILHPFLLPILRVESVPIFEVIEDMRNGRAEGRGRKAQGEERGYVVLRRLSSREITSKSLGLR